MTDIIYFDSSREISGIELKRFCRGALHARLVEFDGQDPKLFSNSTSQTEVYIITRTEAGQFCYHCELYVKNQPRERTKREWVDLLGWLAKETGTGILVSDEGINPYGYIHIEPDGQASPVGIDVEADRRNELSLGEIYNYPLGGFCTETILTELETAVLDELISRVIPSYEFAMHEVEKMNNDFTHHKDRFPQIKNYRYHYFITPRGKAKWHSNDEKSTLLVDMMNAFFDRTKKNICLFPANSVTYRNIPGGSDHEAFCINLNELGMEKIVYKECRKHW